jgi:hypothetical protein
LRVKYCEIRTWAEIFACSQRSRYEMDSGSAFELVFSNLKIG